MTGIGWRGVALVMALTLSDGGAALASGAHCLAEPSEPARAACLAHAAEAAIMRIEARIVSIAAGDQGAGAAALAALSTALARGQRRWRAAIEEDCRARPPRLEREACRLDAATARSIEIEEIVAAARAANGLPEDVSPDCVLILRPRPGAPAGSGRAEIECVPPPGLDPFQPRH